VTWYEQVEDPSKPIWYTEYVSTKDQTPFVLYEVTSETSSMTDGIYCIDHNITGDGRNVEYCQKAWLLDKSNPYANLSWYTSINIKSIIPACNTLHHKECVARKNDPGDCMWHHHKCTDACQEKNCKIEWLEETSFPIGRPCRPFWEYCRGYNPSLYQCDQFWTYCRKRLDLDHPGWTYPKESCVDVRTNKTITTCPIEWLGDKENPFDPLQSGATCYTFWNYCRDNLNRKYANNWTYPIENSYCNHNSSLTCVEDWLNYDTYDEWRLSSGSSFSNDESCRDFFDFCTLQLKARYPRYVWPFIDPPNVDDLMPGRCCLDTPVETDGNSIFWGSHVSLILT